MLRSRVSWQAQSRNTSWSTRSRCAAAAAAALTAAQQHTASLQSSWATQQGVWQRPCPAHLCVRGVRQSHVGAKHSAIQTCKPCCVQDPAVTVLQNELAAQLDGPPGPEAGKGAKRRAVRKGARSAQPAVYALHMQLYMHSMYYDMPCSASSISRRCALQRSTLQAMPYALPNPLLQSRDSRMHLLKLCYFVMLFCYYLQGCHVCWRQGLA
jgi:hypothetical protein